MTVRVLVIEDERILADNISKYLSRAGYRCQRACSGREGLQAFAEFSPEVVLLDLRLGDMNGIEVLQNLKSRDSAASVILMTAYGTIDTAVEAMKAGATEFLTKPVVLRDLLHRIESIAGHNSTSRNDEDQYQHLSRIIGSSRPIQLLKNQVTDLLRAEQASTAGYAPPVLLLGETGTGKELVAQAIHCDGKRCKGPFIEINCSALPEGLVESELFGHERGAFTGATSRKIGLFEAANNGTLFLDEVSEMSLATQHKLLKVLEEQVVRPIGATRGRPVNVRIIAATNRPLEELIARDAFRADLYFRLCTLRITVPPLRERDQDIVTLAQRFLREQAQSYQRPTPKLTVTAIEALIRHPWHGNVRELRNVMERALISTAGTVISPAHLDLTRIPSASTTETRPSGLNLERNERELLSEALAESGWNVTAAARMLGITRDQLRYRIKRHRLQQNRTLN